MGGDAALSNHVGRRDSTGFPSTPRAQISYPTSASWSFKATLNVLQTNALSLLAPFLLARSRLLKTNPYACLGVMVQASSSGRHVETEGPNHSCL